MSETSEMVDRVARAIYNARRDTCIADGADPKGWCDFDVLPRGFPLDVVMAEARAAIAAIADFSYG